MKISAMAFFLALMLLVTACDSSLRKAKDDAIQKLSDKDPILLKEIVLDQMEIVFDGPGAESIDVEGGTILLEAPDQRQDNERCTALEYSKFSVQVVKFAGGNEYSELPAAWGVDDLDKLRHICGASQRSIEEASDFDGLKQAVALLSARGTIAPSLAFDRLVWLEGEQFSGLLSGDFAKSDWMELVMRPTTKPDANYFVQFRRNDGAIHDDVLRFLRSLAFKACAEQGGTEPAAGRSEVKSEGGDKPRPESCGSGRTGFRRGSVSPHGR